MAQLGLQTPYLGLAQELGLGTAQSYIFVSNWAPPHANVRPLTVLYSSKV